VKRNAASIALGVVELHLGSADQLPFEAGIFDAALAINSMQVWPDAPAGLREIGRVIRSGARLAIAFTPHSRQSRTGLAEMVSAAGFVEARIVEGDPGFCVLARKP